MEPAIAPPKTALWCFAAACCAAACAADSVDDGVALEVALALWELVDVAVYVRLKSFQASKEQLTYQMRSREQTMTRMTQPRDMSAKNPKSSSLHGR